MAIVRPYRPNLAEICVYRPMLDQFEVTFYFTGLGLDACRSELNSMGLQAMKAVRYASYPDFISSDLVRRFIDYKVGFGSYMLSHLQDVLRHDYINIVDPIYAFTFQIARSLRPNQKLIVVRWENLYGRYDRVWRAAIYAKRILMRANSIICVSQASLYTLHLPRAFSGKVMQIYPGIDLVGIRANNTQITGGAGKVWCRGDTPTILFVGRLQWTKGLQTLLVTLSILHTHFGRPCRLWVVGGGDQAPFMKLVREFGLERYVEFFGGMTNSQVRQKMQQADLFSLPSVVSPTWMEQFGFALVEAMAHGLPIVTHDSGSIREICGEDGVYASTGNSFSLADNIATLLQNPSTALDRGRRLRLRALREFDADTQGKKMLEAIA